MASRRRATSLFVIFLGLGTALLSGDALPQGYQPRFRRDHRCPTCPRDCSDKLTGQAEMIIDYKEPEAAQTQYAAPAPAPVVAQPSYVPHPTPAPYVAPPTQPQPEYPIPRPTQPKYSSHQPSQSYPQQPPYQPIPSYVPHHTLPPACNCPPNYDPYNDYPGYDCDCGCRCGRSIDDDVYALFRRYNRRSIDESNQFTPKKEEPMKPLPFGDESGPPADLYKNYRPYEKSKKKHDDDDDNDEEQPSRRSSSKDRERLFVVYRADAVDDKPSDRELESVIRTAMEVARQQKSQEAFTLNAHKNKPINRFRYEHEKYQDSAVDDIDFEAFQEKKPFSKPDGKRINLPFGPLMKVEDSYVTEEGDDTLNPGLDQSKWTVVPSLSSMDLIKTPESDDVEEIEAAVHVVPDAPKIKNVMKVPKVIQKINDGTGKVKKETIEFVRTDEVNKEMEIVPELMDDVQVPVAVTEASRFEGPVESPASSAPTTNAST